MSLVQNNMRYFGVLPRHAKLQLTVRTPYATLFEDFNSFTRLYVTTLKGQIAIGARSIPRVYLLPPGEMSVKGMTPRAEGNHTQSETGLFMHTGGWLFVHDNNSIDVALLECNEKESFNFDKLTSNTTETDSPAGKICADLQTKTFKLFQKRR